MMYFMDSKTFRDVYLMHESDKDILKAQYVLISTHIGTSDSLDNVVNATSFLFPSPHVYASLDDEDFEDRYYEQLEDNITFIAQLVQASIKDKFNIIFLSSKSESKSNLLKYLRNFIFLKFEYPCYDYKRYVEGGIKLLKYNKNKILKKCEKIITEASDKRHENNWLSPKGREANMKEYKSLSKKELRKILELRDIYVDENASKHQMLDLINTFS